MKIKCDSVILDIDGTIWDTTGVVAAAWNRAIDKLDLPARKVDAQMLKKEFGKPMDQIAESLWPNLTRRQKFDLMDACCEQEQIALQKNRKRIAFSGVVSTIKKLSKRFDFYIVSNCQSGYIELTMQKLGIEKYIKDYECYGDTKKYKAENLIILYDRNQLKSPVYIGDTAGDYEACKTAGIKFVWASYGFGHVDSCLAELKKFRDLSKLLEPMPPQKEFIRAATTNDAAELLEIYAYYVQNTAVSFEYEIPKIVEFEDRIEATIKKYPFLVIENEKEIIGYAYAAPFKNRAAYDWNVETTIYIRQGYSRQGFGEKLYSTMEKILQMQHILSMNACIAYPKQKSPYLTKNSVHFHKAMGFKKTAYFKECGYKFDEWFDMIWMTKTIGAHTIEPRMVLPFSELKLDFDILSQIQ